MRLTPRLAQPCHSILVSRCGKIVFEDVYGYADVATKEPLQADGIFRWASMTKPVTCVAAMICYERGCFQLDDPLEMSARRPPLALLPLPARCG